MRVLQLALLLLALAAPASAQFRQDEVGPRSFRYGDDYFINVFSYRMRLTHRWQWGEASDPLRRWWWTSPAIGYSVTAGSLTNDDLYVQQGAIVRFPLLDALTGEYRYVGREDYDERYERNEVELLVRLARPGLSLDQDILHTPPEDGLFVGGLGVIEAEKQFADMGLVAGWRGERFGVRFDLIQADLFFNDKADDLQEYETGPITFRARTGLLLLDGRLELKAWVDVDLPLALRFPLQGDLTFRWRQLQAGVGARWEPRPGVRFDLEAWAERTRERRRSIPVAELNDDVDREALMAFGALELDCLPLLGDRSSRQTDALLLGFMGHYLEEETDSRAAVGDVEIRRGEGYGELGYVLGLPSFLDDLTLAVRVSTQQGAVSFRDVREGGRHTVSVRYLAKLGMAFEAGFRNDLAVAVVHFTYRADNQTFGGGNVQVQFRF